MKMNKKLILIFAIVFSVSFIVSAQQQVKFMSYNLLNYPGTDTTGRNPYFRTIISSVNPDILVVQEITSQDGVNGFLANVMNSFGQNYSAGDFIDGPDSDNGIFFKSSLFTFISNTPIQTTLRDISEFKLVNKSTGDTLRIYSVHLKSSTGTTNVNQRSAEVDSLRQVTNRLPAGSNFIVCGDFNLYNSNEPAYIKLLQDNAEDDGNFNDPVVMPYPSNWNNVANALYHTQSPRVRSFGGGSTGGIDDRFDLILFSNGILNPGEITYVNGSMTVIGNDGNHYNDSVNSMPNIAVSQDVANALHYASDHLPVSIILNFDNPLPVELNYFKYEFIDGQVNLYWETATETNNYGFAIERISTSLGTCYNYKQIGFVKGKGNSNSLNKYSFMDNHVISTGIYRYRLKMLALDGTVSFSKEIELNINLEKSFSLFQNYPNPFNPETKINFSIPEDSKISLKVFNVNGVELASLVNGNLLKGNYEVTFSTSRINFPAGVYFYSLEASTINGSFYKQTRKMILAK